MSLSLRDVTYAYRSVGPAGLPAVAGVDLVVSPGELVLIAGTTGSGKSTLLRLASGLLEPESGVAEIDGVPLTRRTARGTVGLVFQDAESQLFADTLLDDVAFGPRNLGVSPEASLARARLALDSVGLEPDGFASRSPFSLSGGEARRAAMAGVLAMDARYLLADEPTAGLDAAGRAAVIGLLLEARSAAGVVVVSHTVEELLGHADKVLLLVSGRSAWWGPADRVVQDPSLLREAGLRPPAVLEVMELARQRGCFSGPLTTDPVLAASALLRARGC